MSDLAGMPPVVVLDDVHMRYRIFEDGGRRARAQRLLRGKRGRTMREVHALKGVSITIPHGQRLGLIGRNGSGKSTMLSIVAGLLTPTEGRVLASSYPVLLGISAALNKELSGHSNVILGCTALGMRRTEALDRASEIIAYAGLEEFAHVPMRAYSAGMRARLNFSIATVVEPEILLIDEALAAGDARFRRRSRDRVREITERAGSVVLVSHSTKEVRDMCDRVVWLDKGSIVMDGPADEVTAAYDESEGAT
ncbi:ABC transporter ATP-binding protein [Euzebya rosea]|uniref:ABC transporter ATP-binding protein n=1 Tax=Euzebya rosea TaxID=2052804 RepID=UPI001F0BB24A|nr:ATP-binding cassette domain-containing protein [Euzebya rosea]